MRFTLMTGIGGHEDYVAIAKAAEDAGWGTISVPDSFFYPKTTESEYPYSDHDMIRGFLEVSPFIEPIVAMSFMAAATKRIRFCAGVMKVPMRQPLILAKQITSLAVMSGERIDLGAGLSPWKEDFTYNGVPFEKRGERFDEVIAIIRDAQKGEFFEHHTANYDFGAIRMAPLPKKPIPVIIGGHAKPALQRAARLGDGWFSANSEPDTLKRMIDELNGYRREYGTQNHPDFRIHAFNQFAQTPDDFKQLRDLGATDLCAMGWNPFEENLTVQAKLDSIRRFGDEVIAKV